MDTKILKRLIREKFGRRRPSAAEILKLMEVNNLREKKTKRGRPRKKQ